MQHWRHLGPDIIDVDPTQVGMTVLHDLGVQTVVIDRYKMPGGNEREYTESVANALFAGQTATFADERITVYSVTSPEAPQPYLQLGPLNWGKLTEADGVSYRAVGDGPAEVLLRHTQRGAQVVIAYQSDADGVVSSTDGDSWKLPAAPNGGEMTVDLLMGVDMLTFSAPSEQVRVTRLGVASPC